MQNITRQALLTLRWFFDYWDTDFALVLIGLSDVRRKLAKEVRSRGSKVVEFDLVPDNEIVKFLNRFDPIFATANAELLQRRHKTHAHGEIRWWAYFLREAQQYLPTSGGELTDELVEICAEGVPRL